MNVELHVQDGDSSAGKAILGHFPNCEIVQCGNHFAKNHKKRLIELKGMKTFNDKMINRYEVSSEQIKIKCHCEKRHHKARDVDSSMTILSEKQLLVLSRVYQVLEWTHGHLLTIS